MVVLKLGTPFKPSPSIGIANLPKHGYIASGSGILLGYGCTKTSCDNSKLLMAEVSIARGQTCEKIWKSSWINNETQFCTNSHEAGGCHGDSGSPLLCLDKDGGQVVCGILLRGTPNCSTVGNVYADIAANLELLGVPRPLIIECQYCIRWFIVLTEIISVCIVMYCIHSVHINGVKKTEVFALVLFSIIFVGGITVGFLDYCTKDDEWLSFMMWVIYLCKYQLLDGEIVEEGLWRILKS